MNPIRVFLSMFAIGILAAVILGFVGLNQNPEQAGDELQPEVVAASPEELVQQSCINCHGNDLKGGMGGAAPSLVSLDIDKDEIVNVLTNGKGVMPPGLANGQEEAVADYLLSIQE